MYFRQNVKQISKLPQITQVPIHCAGTTLVSQSRPISSLDYFSNCQA